jgi:UDP-N-acetylglucosamine--N-acetylmuramyl-(pentapeptide) pyrophosphoryl-undecaprenol N-acetylglucosamine transferase
VVEYIDRMDLAFAAADLAMCRAGANSVTEAAAVGLPAVYVPLPIGNGEQRKNAESVVAAGGGILVDDADLTTAWVVATVPQLAADTDRLTAMGAAAAAVIRRDADEKVARIVLEVAAQEPTR